MISRRAWKQNQIWSGDELCNDVSWLTQWESNNQEDTLIKMNELPVVGNPRGWFHASFVNISITS